MATISRDEFDRRYRTAFNILFQTDISGACVARHANSWESLEFPDMTLPGWSGDSLVFENTMKFIAPVTNLDQFVITEIESIEKFLEIEVVMRARERLDNLWVKSVLPHFKSACFDESANWCGIFDWQSDSACFYRKP
jgi:hypothetical protein